jgi:hypothetical protein
MKFASILAAIIIALLLRTPAVAQSPASESPAIENVIVTAPELRPEKALDNFIIAHSTPTALLGKIARWKTGICPVTLGLSDRLNRYITERIVRVAMTVGAPLDTNEPCKPNVTVLVTDRPQQLLDTIRTRHGALLGYHYMWQARDLATMRLPIQAWYATATEDFWGMLQADETDLAIGRVARKIPGLYPVTHASGFHGMDGLKSEFVVATIVVDKKKIAGRQIGPLSDYIAMLALSQAKSYDACQDVPSITNLMAEGCGADMKPQALTDIDVAYLRGLYKAGAGFTYVGERGAIAYEMKKALATTDLAAAPAERGSWW